MEKRSKESRTHSWFKNLRECLPNSGTKTALKKEKNNKNYYESRLFYVAGFSNLKLHSCCTFLSLDVPKIFWNTSPIHVVYSNFEDSCINDQRLSMV